MSNNSISNNNHSPLFADDDLLWRQLKTIPAFRALLRAVEARFYQHLDLPQPILDLGCGDGHFAQVTFDEPFAAGIDPWWGPLQKSQQSGMYRLLAQSMGDEMPFPDHHFATVISNSVLEHIPDIQPVLNEASRVLRPGGQLVITMPTHYFTEYLGGAGFFEQIGAPGLASRYRRFFNRISRHAHTDPPELWADRLAQAGFRVERWQYYFSREALHALELGHAQGVPAAVMQALTGHWIVAPWESSLRRTEQWVRPFYDEPFNPHEGAYQLIIARKEADHAIDAPLPAARPYSLAELQPPLPTPPTPALPTPPTDAASELLAPPTEILEMSPAAAPAVERPSSPQRRGVFAYSMVLLSLAAAVIGQMVIGGDAARPGDGVGWFVLAAIPLLLLGWRQGVFPRPTLPSWRLPRPGAISRRRWLLLPALLLAWVGFGFTSTPGAERPFPALLLWAAGVALAWYAMQIPFTESRPRWPRPDPFALLAGGALFVAAWVLRSIDLTTHPFILNGIEASLGQNAAQIGTGVLRNPFGVGWLTNPTLPLFALALPIRLLGQSVLAVRVLSPLVGALTVAATFWLGRRLYGTAVGLTAAVLLFGSHFHLHYSRLGMTNVWEPLLALLALGLLALAWRDDPTSDNPTADNQTLDNTNIRRRWLAAGAAIGLNAFLFTNVRLLPVVLAALLLWALLWQRRALWAQGPHLLAAAAVALVTALPMLLFYNGHADIFMQRANDLGIFAGQTGWLAQEAVRQNVAETAVLRQQLWRGLLAFGSGLDKSPAYRPGTPLLSFGPALFFGLGLLAALFRGRRLRYALLPIWVVVTALLAGAFLIETPSSHRLLIAAPALALLAAIALETYGRFILSAIAPPSRARARRLFVPLLAAIALIFISGDLLFYFGRYRVEHMFADRNTEIADRMAGYLSTLPEDDFSVYFYGPPSMYSDFPTLSFLVPTFQRGYNIFDIEPGQAERPSPPTAQLSFVVLPERSAELADIEAAYPDGNLRTISGYYADPLFYVYEWKAP